MRIQQIHIKYSTLKFRGMERGLEGVFKNTGPHLPACTCMTCHGKTPAPAFPVDLHVTPTLDISLLLP